MNKTILTLTIAALMSTAASATVISASEYNYDKYGHYFATGLIYTPDGRIFADAFAQAYKVRGGGFVEGAELGAGFRPTPTSAVRLGYGDMGSGSRYWVVSGEYQHWFGDRFAVYGGVSYTATNGPNTRRAQAGIDFNLGSSYYLRTGYSIARTAGVDNKALVVVFSKVFE